MLIAFKRTACVFAAVFWVAGCSAISGQVAEPPPEAPAVAEFSAQAYAGIPADAGRVYRIDSRTSVVRFYLWRGGPMAAQGHNHVMVVKKMAGAVFVPADIFTTDMRFDILFAAADIELDPPPLRKELGGAFGTAIAPEGVRKTRERMLGEKVLDARQFPTIGLRANTTYGEPPKMVFDTAITLHGVRRRRLIPATVSMTGDRLSARGAFAITQTDFGIEPISALNGALYVLDPIMIEFEIRATSRSAKK